MEQLDKEVIDELSEPAKRVFRSLDYRSQRRMLKKAQEMGKQKRRKTQQKEWVKKKSITKKQKKKEQAKERGSSTKRNQSRTASFVGTEIKSIIRPEIEEGRVLQKKAMWMEMAGK